jgi:hypothetical protein
MLLYITKCPQERKEEDPQQKELQQPFSVLGVDQG